MGPVPHDVLFIWSLTMSGSVERNGKNTVPATNTSATSNIDNLLDTEWAKGAFLMAGESFSTDFDFNNRFWSSASGKFVDTRLGQNIGINSKPQWCRYSDIRNPGRLDDRVPVSPMATSGNHGLGEYYSEAIDDPAQVIYMRMGVPSFNSLTTFLSRAFDPNAIAMVHTGRPTSMWYTIGKTVGAVGVFAAFPTISLAVMAGKFISSLFLRPNYKFYTLKPDMTSYWFMVDHLTNTLAVNLGILPKILQDDNGTPLSRPMKIDDTHLENYSALMPDIIRPGSRRFDVFAMANQAQLRANKLFAKDYEAMQAASTASDYTGRLKKQYDGGTHATYITNDKNVVKWDAVLDRMAMFGWYQNKSDAKNPNMVEVDPRLNDKGEPNTDTSWVKDYAKFFDAEFRDGTQFAVFRVDHTGPTQYSFSNSVTESQISEKLNKTSSDVRELKFSFADGNLVGGAVGDLIGSAVGAVKDLATGIASGVTFGISDGILGLLGGGYVDIPKHWQSSTASLPRASYKMTLMAPYNNVISRLQDIFIPYFMILAAGLPRATGKSSYGSPFLVELYDRGRCQIRTGMIESISINAGGSHLSHDIRGNALMYEVTWNIVDLSSMITMPVSAGFTDSIDMTLDEDNLLADHLAVLASQDLYSQTYSFEKAKLVLAKKIMQAGVLTSPAAWAAVTHNSMTNGIMSYTGIGAILEGMSRGTSLAQRTGT